MRSLRNGEIPMSIEKNIQTARSWYIQPKGDF